MTYVYILQSTANPERHYVGYTADLRTRLQRHNAGGVSHTSKYSPWTIKTYIAFTDKERALAFENTSSRVRAEPSRKSIFDRTEELSPQSTSSFVNETPQPLQFVEPVERRDLVRLSERRIIKHSIAKIFDRAAIREHRLPDVNNFRRTLTDRMNAQQLPRVAIEQ
jgi:putative endonuclease